MFVQPEHVLGRVEEAQSLASRRGEFAQEESAKGPKLGAAPKVATPEGQIDDLCSEDELDLWSSPCITRPAALESLPERSVESAPLSEDGPAFNAKVRACSMCRTEPTTHVLTCGHGVCKLCGANAMTKVCFCGRRQSRWAIELWIFQDGPVINAKVRACSWCHTEPTTHVLRCGHGVCKPCGANAMTKVCFCGKPISGCAIQLSIFDDE
jgi:hypothetical protein